MPEPLHIGSRRERLGRIVAATEAGATVLYVSTRTQYLAELCHRVLVFCGETTSGCVRATVIDACSYRYRVIVPEECSYDRHEACHAINLFDVDQKYADVVPVSEVLERLAVPVEGATRVPEPIG